MASVLIGFAMFAGFLVTTQILQASTATGYGFGLSLLAAGLAMLPIGGAMTIFSPVSARLSRRFSARFTLLAGIAVLAAGNAWLATLPGSIPTIMLASTVTAIGAALAYSAIPLIIMNAVPAYRDGRGEQPEHPDADAGHQLVQRGRSPPWPPAW